MEVDLMLLMEIVDFMVVTVDFMVKIMEDGKMLIMMMDQDFMEGLVGIGAQMVEGLIQMKMVIGKEYRIKGSVTYFQTTPRFRDYYRQPQPIRCSALHSTDPIRL